MDKYIPHLVGSQDGSPPGQVLPLCPSLTFLFQLPHPFIALSYSLLSIIPSSFIVSPLLPDQT
jgi:hypothetical protein